MVRGDVGEGLMLVKALAQAAFTVSCLTYRYCAVCRRDESTGFVVCFPGNSGTVCSLYR
jgi:hypothetical protein